MKRMLTLFTLAILTTRVTTAQIEVNQSAYQRGLAYLVAVQNADGSWGTSNQVSDTAFAVVAFLNHGETTHSPKYGENIQRSLKWLIDQSPSNTLERVSLVHALSTAHAITRIPILREEAERQTKEINADELEGSIAVLLAITGRPDSKSERRQLTTSLLRDFAAHTTDQSPLALYLKTLDAFLGGSDSWKNHNRTVLTPLIRSQADNGSFAGDHARSTVEATSFALLRISVYYRYWTEYLNILYPEPKKPDKEEDIEIDIE